MDKYIVEKIIGEGTYGIVYKAKEKVRLLCRIRLCFAFLLGSRYNVNSVNVYATQASGDYVAIKKFKSSDGRITHTIYCISHHIIF